MTRCPFIEESAADIYAYKLPVFILLVIVIIVVIIAVIIVVILVVIIAVIIVASTVTNTYITTKLSSSFFGYCHPHHRYKHQHHYYHHSSWSANNIIPLYLSSTIWLLFMIQPSLNLNLPSILFYLSQLEFIVLHMSTILTVLVTFQTLRWSTPSSWSGSWWSFCPSWGQGQHWTTTEDITRLRRLW